MTVDEALAAPVSDPTIDAPRGRRRARMRAGLRKPSNWLQLVRFATVGASGYVVNLVVFTLLVHVAAIDYRLAAVGAFAVALTNNFLWNRTWTFRGSGGRAGFQAARFCVVSLAAFGFNLVVLFALVEGLDVPKVPAQALAIAAATPLSFLGNKLWSFRA
ncbi:MAG TPA: GtrA family protein [Solirubrobacteraceae bacterium]|jgi:putative flippase GtrA|nr:GtrA family protein [Solirubrobacteraceae bacterium]